MDNLIGKKLDGLYEVKELIGSGGMANVYKAVMLGRNGPVPAGTVVAVKVLRQEYTHDPELVRRFKNESKAISLLNHPNIVKVYDVSVNDQLQYIVMEYVDGMTLREYLNERGGKLTSRETVHFISQILKALEHAHANGVVHRDIKPQNIMLLDNGQLRMMDFGIARISRAENQLLSGKTMGSVAIPPGRQENRNDGGHGRRAFPCAVRAEILRKDISHLVCIRHLVIILMVHNNISAGSSCKLCHSGTICTIFTYKYLVITPNRACDNRLNAKCSAALHKNHSIFILRHMDKLQKFFSDILCYGLGCIGPKSTAYYELRAKGGAAAVTVSELMVHPSTDGSHAYHLDESILNSLACATYTADAIRRHGAIPSIELSHSGMYSGTYMTDKIRDLI